MYCQFLTVKQFRLTWTSFFVWIVSGLFQALPMPSRSANHPHVTCLLVVAGELFPVSCGCLYSSSLAFYSIALLTEAKEPTSKRKAKKQNKTKQNKKNKKWATLPRKEFSITSNSAIRFRLNTFAMFGKFLPLAKLLIKSKAYVHAALNTSQVGENSRTAL